MLQKDIKVGGVYVAKVSNKITRVRVDNIRTVQGRGLKMATRYDVTNLATGRTTTFRSASKFRKESILQDGRTMSEVRATSPTGKLVNVAGAITDPFSTIQTAPAPRKPSDIMVDREPSETEAQVAWIVSSMLTYSQTSTLTQHRKEAYAAGHKAGFLKAIAILRDELKAIK